jgi:hypothetical protein
VVLAGWLLVVRAADVAQEYFLFQDADILAKIQE